ncbi:hypothetical protein [Haliangium sp.]|uniref:hypothetical protein n=1 Tax=Haliangium sp. TaxID=2663208 RepID=UPI003D1181B8
MSRSAPVPPPADVGAVRAAAERLAARLSRRAGRPAELTDCTAAVPMWWREGIADVPIFGDGLASIPATEDGSFSRPVSFLSAREISMVAGGEYVPVAWLDGGVTVALVHDRGALPVVAVALADMQRADPSGAEGVPLAPSLVAFLDALAPQTVCRLEAPGSHLMMELIGDSSLLVEHAAGLEQHDFDSTDDLGSFVASFLEQAIEAGYRLGFCSALLRPVIEARVAAVDASAADLPETRARTAILWLLADGSLELEGMDEPDDDDDDIDNVDDASDDLTVSVDPEQLEDLIDAAARFLERNGRSRNLAKRFAEWLSQQPGVVDLYADDDTVHTALHTAPLERGQA